MDRALSEFNLARQSHAENVNRTQMDSRSGWFEHRPLCIPKKNRGAPGQIGWCATVVNDDMDSVTMATSYYRSHQNWGFVESSVLNINI